MILQPCTCSCSFIARLSRWHKRPCLCFCCSCAKPQSSVRAPRKLFFNFGITLSERLFVISAVHESRVCGTQLKQQVAHMLISKSHQCHHMSDWDFECGCKAASGRSLSWKTEANILLPCSMTWQVESLKLSAWRIRKLFKTCKFCTKYLSGDKHNQACPGWEPSKPN